jgi:phospholipase/lecithinase/hemolysin
MNRRIPLRVAGLWLAGSTLCSGQSGLTNFTALYVFGDSFAATAGGPYCGGKWSNGPMWPEFLSTNLGFAYQAQNNRAVGAATSTQVLAQVGSLPAPANAGSALFVVCLGYNDFGPSWPITSDPTWSNVTRVAVLNWSNSVATCYEKGARTAVALNFIDFNVFPGLARAVPDRAYARRKTIEANAALRAAREGLRLNYPDLRLVTIDHFGAGDLLATNFASYGFSRIDLGALEDRLLSDKSCNGPGKDYFFWDGAHTTSKAHALFADLLLAALRGTRMALAQERDGFRLTIEPLQIGRTYRLQQSADLMHWEELSAFPAARFAWDAVIAFGTGSSFYRLTSDE